jgi:hypothetical protein
LTPKLAVLTMQAVALPSTGRVARNLKRSRWQIKYTVIGEIRRRLPFPLLSGRISFILL